MAQLGNVLLCAAAMAALWTLIGLPVSASVLPRERAWPFAPALGWAVHSVVMLPLSGWIGMNRPVVLAGAAVCAVAAAAAWWRQGRGAASHRSLAMVLVAVAVAVLFAAVPMAGMLPKPTPDGVTLASPIFDHSKIAMVDEMIRSGVPVRNAFFGEIGAPDRIAYYYLWHFSAAWMALAVGVSGWEADAALTAFTAFVSVLTMTGFAMAWGARPTASIVVAALAASASVRTALAWVWPEGAPAVIGWGSGFGGVLFQASWAPQHVASAVCVVIACALLPELAGRRGWLVSVVLGLVAAAAFQSSVWVGGVVFPLAALAIGLRCLVAAAPAQRMRFAFRAGAAAVIAIVLALPFVMDQLTAAALRGNAPVVALAPVSVLGTAFPEGLRRILDVPAYWLVYLPVEFPAFFVAGAIGLAVLWRSAALAPDSRETLRSLAILAAVSAVVAWLVASVVGDNNDLGWRAILPAAMVLIPAAAVLISQLRGKAAQMAALIAAAGALLGLPETLKIAGENLHGLRKPSERAFAATPAMWEAVRRHTATAERVAGNPLFLADMTPWPVNISWALLADRRSCYAGNELAIPFAAIPAARRAEIEAQFVRVFAGDPAQGDVRQIAERFRCDTVVVTPQDGAWRRDPFASAEFYSLAESRPDGWRIYRRVAR